MQALFPIVANKDRSTLELPDRRPEDQKLISCILALDTARMLGVSRRMSSAIGSVQDIQSRSESVYLRHHLALGHPSSRHEAKCVSEVPIIYVERQKTRTKKIKTYFVSRTSGERLFRVRRSAGERFAAALLLVQAQEGNYLMTAAGKLASQQLRTMA